MAEPLENFTANDGDFERCSGYSAVAPLIQGIFVEMFSNVPHGSKWWNRRIEDVQCLGNRFCYGWRLLREFERSPKPIKSDNEELEIIEPAQQELAVHGVGAAEALTLKFEYP
ncbi:hypothetical protein [Blastochloris sulfoviridis]|uniref:Uncharacterized protein n=1 Tax=Blastochloris sulfoviridis TaxID=50712 RepID=A0A5M6HQK9_9HYPH|nr:hypothetical protein [Blastochloris sulfoviridis]KAA5598120.1 hypothetical protein F1193_14185 [Blastochloris sulfoviridis]